MDAANDKPAGQVGATASRRSSEGDDGMHFAVARDVEQVTECWRLVYEAYRRSGLINANPAHVHTAPQAISPDTAVILGAVRDVVASTITVMPDSDEGLPLDRVFSDQLDPLRAEGRTLMEFGLFADRRKHLTRTAESLFQLMRYCFHFAMGREVTDFVLGVHPRHARFYTRAFGFEAVSDQRQYQAVNFAPVVLLRGDLSTRFGKQEKHPALNYVMENPVSAEVFAERFSFSDEALAGSPIAEFLQFVEQRKNLRSAG